MPKVKKSKKSSSKKAAAKAAPPAPVAPVENAVVAAPPADAVPFSTFAADMKRLHTNTELPDDTATFVIEGEKEVRTTKHINPSFTVYI